jgi:hypothetical protein
MMGMFQKVEIRKLLLFAGAAALIAGVAVGAVVWRATGSQYLGKRVILAPDILTGERSLSELEPVSRLQRAWVFSRVDFYDGQRRHHEVKPEAYAVFYGMVAAQKSVRRAEDLACHFEGQRVMRLVLSLDPTGRFAAAYSPRQCVEVQFSPDGELFRVEVAKGWAYFHSPGIGHEAKQLFVGGR